MESTRNLLLPQVSLEAEIDRVVSVTSLYYGPQALCNPLPPDDIKTNWTRFIIVSPPVSPPIDRVWAIRNSIQAQHPYIEPPGIAELFEMWKSQEEKSEETVDDWMTNISLLAGVLYTWGEAHGQYLILGVVMDNGTPFWYDQPTKPLLSVTVWVHLDESHDLFSGLKRIMDPLPGSSLSANVTAAISQPSQSSQGEYVLPQDVGAFQGQLLGTNGNNPRGVSSDETRGPVSQSVDVPMQNWVSPPIYTPGETPEADPITLFLQQQPQTNTVHGYDTNESGTVTTDSKDILPETLHRANAYESSNVSGSSLRKTYTTLFFHLNEAEHSLLARALASDIISVQLSDGGLLWWPTADIEFNDDPHLPGSSVTAALVDAGLDKQALERVLDENRERLILGGRHGRPYDALFVDAQRRFASALLRRCCYIAAFEQHFLHCPADRVISESSLYPLLGPDPDTDDFVLRHGLLPLVYAPPRPREASKPDPMVNMYGFKYRDLLCIRNNPNGAERVSNWDTILRYHILQTWLGPSHCTDVRETLIYAFKHLEDLRKQARARYQTRAHQLLAAPLRSAAYFRLEMDVAAQMIARLWEDARTHDSRTIPSVRRKKFSAVGSPRRGQWDDLPPALQWALLGWPLRTDLAEKYARFVKLPFPAATGLGAGGIGGEGSESSARGGEGGEGGGRSDWVKQAAKAVLGEFTALVL